MNKEIAKVKILGVVENIAFYYFHTQEGFTTVHDEEENGFSEFLYSILVFYVDGSKEIIDGLGKDEMKKYLPFVD